MNYQERLSWCVREYCSITWPISSNKIFENEVWVLKFVLKNLGLYFPQNKEHMLFHEFNFGITPEVLEGVVLIKHVLKHQSIF